MSQENGIRAQDYLCRIKRLDAMIRNKKAELGRLRLITYNTGHKTDGVKVQTFQKSGKQGVVDACVDMEQEINAAIRTYIRERVEIIRTIEKLPLELYDLMHKIYVQGKSFQEAADEYGKSRSWVKGKHGKALKAVQNMLNAREEQNG